MSGSSRRPDSERLLAGQPLAASPSAGRSPAAPTRSGSGRPPGGAVARAAAMRGAWPLALLLAGLAGFATAAPPEEPAATAPGTTAGTSAPASPPLRLALAADEPVTGEVERFLREDRAWLEQRPAGQRRLQGPDDAASARAWLGQLGQPVRAAAADSAAGARGLSARLRDRWLERGYLACRVAVDDGGGEGAPRLLVAPGSPYRIGRVRVQGPDFPGRSALLARSLPAAGSRFRAAAWELAVARILAGAGEAGFPFARWVVEAVAVRPADATVDVEATLFTGRRAVLGALSSDLAAPRAAAFLQRACGLRRGGLYRESDLERARERLLARDLWERVGEPVVYAAGADTVGVHWPLVPRARPNRVAAVLGLSRRDAASRARVSGQVDLWLPNLGGSGRRLGAAWSDDGAGRSHLGFAYLEPLAFGSALDLETVLDHEVAADAYTRFRADARARLAVVAAWGLELGLGWDRGTYPSGDWARTTRWRARAAFLHRRGDQTRSGWEGIFAYETARRRAEARGDTGGGTAAGSGVGRQRRQRLWELSAAGELFLAPRASLAARGALHEVKGDGSPIPLSEQYWFGGARSLRGYGEGQFRGEMASYGSLEARIGKPRQARLYTFWDLGYFRYATAVASGGDAGERQRRSGTAYGYGLGLEVGTPSGDVSLAIGFPNTLDFGSAKLHVSLLQAF